MVRLPRPRWGKIFFFFRSKGSFDGPLGGGGSPDGRPPSSFCFSSSSPGLKKKSGSKRVKTTVVHRRLVAQSKGGAFGGRHVRVGGVKNPGLGGLIRAVADGFDMEQTGAANLSAFGGDRSRSSLGEHVEGELQASGAKQVGGDPRGEGAGKFGGGMGGTLIFRLRGLITLKRKEKGATTNLLKHLRAP